MRCCGSKVSVPHPGGESMRAARLLAYALLCLFLAARMSHAQGVGASGNISGTVTDPSGAAIPNATITALEADRGIRHTSASDDAGRYQFIGLPPATYDVTARVSGFQTVIQKGVIVTVGGTAIVDFQLKVATAAQTVEVSAQPPVVETERGSQSDTLTDRYITDLPIDRRDYLTFTLLMPGVSNSTRLADDQDFRVKQTPQSGLSFYGSNGRGNSVTVDGGEANDDAGGVRLTVSQDAVQEFQINRSNYGADLGGASGASINIVSKSGTNDVHGSAYGFFRNDAMDARNPFAFTQALAPGQTFNPAAPDLQGTPTKDTLTREQFGGSFGFPISKDKTFVFFAAEGLRADAQNAVPLVTNTNVFRPDTGTFSGNGQTPIIQGLASLAGNPSVPCLSNGANPPTMLPAATCAAILNNILTINPATSPLSSFLVNQFENNGGLFKYNTREYFISGRLDHVFSDSNQAYLRY